MVIVRDTDLEAKRRPAKGEFWQHRNGPYRIVGIANDMPEPRGNYPVTVIYENQNGKLFTGALSDWHRRMTLIGNHAPEGTSWKPCFQRLFGADD